MSESFETRLQQLLVEGEVWFAERRTGTAYDKPAYDKNAVLRFGAEDLDRALPLGGLSFGAIHEFGCKKLGSRKQLPLTLLPAILAAQLFKQRSNCSLPGKIFWIGKQCWPTPHVLSAAAGSPIYKQCVFLDPPSDKLHLWSIELALRSRGTALVISALTSLRPILIRRFALAARAGGGIAILLRPAAALSAASPSASRWLVAPAPSPTSSPRLHLTLLKYRGGEPRQREWIVECSYGDTFETLSLCVPTGVVFQQPEVLLQQQATSAKLKLTAGR